MKHPLRSDQFKSLRKDVVSLFRQGFSIQRESNIVFVCGGNCPADMRRKFQDEFEALLPEFEFFEPEFALKNYFGLGDVTPFDISEFEEFVGELAHSIVLFPEAPGSFAETGYFSAREALAQKIILAIDGKRQRNDSFISLGPAKKIHDASIFQPNIQFDYDAPDFSVIATRICERSPLSKYRCSFEVKSFAETTTFELFSLIHQLVDLLVVATVEDVEFFLRSIYQGHLSTSKVKKILSILVGSKRLGSVGEYGHLKVINGRAPFMRIREGFKTQYTELTVKISQALVTSDQEFLLLLGGEAHAD